MTKVLIVEDQLMAQKILAQAVEAAGERYFLAGCLRIADDALPRCSIGDIDLILMDVCTAQGTSGIHAAAQIKQRYPNIKIIIVTSMPEFRFINEARKAGADSFCYKDLQKEELVAIMDATMEGQHIFPDSTPSVKLGDIDSKKLTDREMEVLYWIVQGLSLPDIAKKLFISETTVRYHLENMKQKTGCKTKLELAIMAVETSLILPHFA